jgi:hypothetical protein
MPVTYVKWIRPTSAALEAVFSSGTLGTQIKARPYRSGLAKPRVRRRVPCPADREVSIRQLLLGDAARTGDTTGVRKAEQVKYVQAD